MTKNLIVLLVLGTTLASSAAAQMPGELSYDTATARPDTLESKSNRHGEMTAAGFGLGMMSWLAGGIIADSQDRGEHSGFDFPSDQLYVAAAAGAIGMGTGVHLGNARRGNWLLTTATSLTVGVGCTALAAENDQPLWIAAVPLVQIITTVAVESALTDEPPEAPTPPRAQLGLMSQDDRLGLVIGGRF